MININTAWEYDLLNRKEEGKFLINYLLKRYDSNRKKSFVLNINAEWGFGKTYFLENIAKELSVKKYPVIYFDAWKNDFTNQPLLAFISELNSSLSPYFTGSSKAKSLLDDTINISKNIILPVIIKKLTGSGKDELEELIDIEIDSDIENGISSLISKSAELALRKHVSIQNNIELFKEKMIKLLSHIDKKMTSKELPMFIFIDELDRCRPNYAIELLESIKHIFDIPGLVFVVATDSKQLSHSINAIYGNNFSSERYLKRFFNQEYNLTEPNIYAFSNYLFEINNLSNSDKLFSPLEATVYVDKNLNVELFSLYSKYFNLSLRDQEQVVMTLSAIELTWQGDKVIHLGYLLFLIMIKQKENSLFYKFANYKDSSFIKNEINDMDVNLSVVCTTKKSMERFRDPILSEYTITKIIEIYINLNGKTSEKIYAMNSNEGITRNISNQVAQELPNSYSSMDGPPKYNLDFYLELVLRAGHFS